MLYSDRGRVLSEPLLSFTDFDLNYISCRADCVVPFSVVQIERIWQVDTSESSKKMGKAVQLEKLEVQKLKEFFDLVPLVLVWGCVRQNSDGHLQPYQNVTEKHLTASSNMTKHFQKPTATQYDPPELQVQGWLLRQVHRGIPVLLWGLLRQESKRCIVTLGSDSHVTKSYQGLQLSRCWWDQIRQSRAGIVATSYLPPIERSAYEDTQGLRGINQLLFSEVSARFIDHCYDAQMEPLCQAPLAHSRLDIHQTCFAG